MKTTLETTRSRIQKKQKETDELQTSFAPDEVDELRTLEANRRYWKKWLANVNEDIDIEPQRVRDFYRVASTRIEPLGIVYLVGSRDLEGR
jgi:hypothetical protein